MPTVLLDARRPVAESWPVGAHLADLDRDLSAPVVDAANGGRHPLPALDAWCRTLGTWGIEPATSVVVMDGRGGGLAAARAWWMLRAVGHEDVRIAPIEGPLTSEPTPPADAPPYPATRWHWPTVDADEVERRRADPEWRLLDARSGPRFRGEVEPFDPQPGRIAGAVSLPWEETVGVPDDLLRARIEGLLGGTPIERVVAACGSGVTACHTLYQLDRLGFGRAALYVGSYSEWVRQGRPVGQGP